jgi:hypothetical protein
MSVSVEILDAVTASLVSNTNLSAYTIERQIMPDIDKKDLGNTIIVTLNGILSEQHSRATSHLVYDVGVGLYTPCTAITDYESAMGDVEEIQNWLTRVDNLTLSTPSGTACARLPFEMSTPFDAAMLKEANVYFCITDLSYTFQQSRRTP